MTDEPDKPKLSVISERSQKEIDTNFAQQRIDYALLQLAANVIRVVRGAGKPDELIDQCARVINSSIDYEEASGRELSSYAISSAIRMKRPEIDDYELFSAGRLLAMNDMVSGALQVTASSLLNQPLQIKAGQDEMNRAFRELEDLYAELRKKRAAEAAATRQKPAPKKKTATRKAPKPKL